MEARAKQVSIGSGPSESQPTMTALENAGGCGSDVDIGEAAARDRLDAVQYGPDGPVRCLAKDGRRHSLVFRRMLMPSEAETARRATTAAEKVNEVPSMRK